MPFDVRATREPKMAAVTLPNLPPVLAELLERFGPPCDACDAGSDFDLTLPKLDDLSKDSSEASEGEGDDDDDDDDAAGKGPASPAEAGETPGAADWPEWDSEEVIQVGTANDETGTANDETGTANDEPGTATGSKPTKKPRKRKRAWGKKGGAKRQRRKRTDDNADGEYVVSTRVNNKIFSVLTACPRLPGKPAEDDVLKFLNSDPGQGACDDVVGAHDDQCESLRLLYVAVKSASECDLTPSQKRLAAKKIVRGVQRAMMRVKVSKIASTDGSSNVIAFLLKQLSITGQMAECPAVGPLVRAVKACVTHCVDIDSVNGMRADVKTNGVELSSGGVSVELLVPAARAGIGFGGIESPSARMTLSVTGIDDGKPTWETRIQVGGTFVIRREEKSGDAYQCDMCCDVTGAGRTRGGSISAAAKQMYVFYFGTSPSRVVQSSTAYAKYLYLTSVVFSGDPSKWARAAKTWQVLRQLQRSLQEKASMLEDIQKRQAERATELVQSIESVEDAQNVAKTNGLDDAKRPTQAHLQQAIRVTCALLNARSSADVDVIVAEVDKCLLANDAGLEFALNYTGYFPELTEARDRVKQLKVLQDEADREAAEEKKVRDAANAAAAKIAMERRNRARRGQTGRQLRSGIISGVRPRQLRPRT
jgi:hypothetical protein